MVYVKRVKHLNNPVTVTFQVEAEEVARVTKMAAFYTQTKSEFLRQLVRKHAVEMKEMVEKKNERGEELTADERYIYDFVKYQI